MQPLIQGFRPKPSQQAQAVSLIERALSDFVDYERLNYLMLMMVDPNVHFHVIPRYSLARRWHGIEFADAGWPGPPQFANAIALTPGQIVELSSEISSRFR